MIEFVFRPIERWPQEPTPNHRKKYGHFKVTYNRMMEDLSRELSMLGVRRAYIQADVEERDIRIDGFLRSDSRPRSSRIIVSAETKHGPVMLPCDTYVEWKDNLRAISLSLEALRAVDRYGVTKRGEQYRGLKQLTSGTGPVNSDEAASFIASQVAVFSPRELKSDVEKFRSSYRAAAKKLHPDHGGDTKQWHDLQVSAAILRQHHGIAE